MVDRKIAELHDYKPLLINLIIDNQNQVINKFGFINRKYKKLNNIPEKIVNTFIFSEDRKFYKNYGVDFLAILRTTFYNIISFGKKKLTGASTITQQVVRGLFLNQNLSILRKVLEISISFLLSFLLKKEQILEIYFNEIYFGSNVYGINIAAKHYFNKKLKDLKIEEIAFLTCLIQSPNYYGINSKQCILKAKALLKRMKINNIISNEEYEESIKNIDIMKINNNKDKIVSNHFVERIKKKLNKLKLYANGLKIKTTVNKNIQEIVLKVAKNGAQQLDRIRPWEGPLSLNLNDINKYYHYKKYGLEPVILHKNGYFENSEVNGNLIPSMATRYSNLMPEKCIALVGKNQKNEYYLSNAFLTRCAVMVVNHKNGEVLAFTGGDINQSYYDGTKQVKRSIGSIAKVFSLLLCVENGFMPNDIVNDQPIYIDIHENIHYFTDEDFEKLSERDKSQYKKVKNWQNKYFGDVSLRYALNQSLNTPWFIMVNRIGVKKLQNLYKKVQLKYSGSIHLSSSIESVYCSLSSIVQSLCIIANGGYSIKLHFIKSIEDQNNNLLYSYEEKESKQIINTRTANIINHVLYGAFLNGTGKELKTTGFKYLCCKTGTASTETEIMFVCWSRNILIYVMMYKDNYTPLGKVWGSGIPLQIAKEILNNIKEIIIDEPIDLSSSLITLNVDPLTGLPDENGIAEIFEKVYSI